MALRDSARTEKAFTSQRTKIPSFNCWRTLTWQQSKLRSVTPDLYGTSTSFSNPGTASGIAFLSNEDGLSKLHILDSATRKERTVPKIPVGVMSGPIWHRNNRDLGYGLQTGSAPGDCYSLDVVAVKLSAGQRAKRVRTLCYFATPSRYGGRRLTAGTFPDSCTGHRPSSRKSDQCSSNYGTGGTIALPWFSPFTQIEGTRNRDPPAKRARLDGLR